MLGKPGPFQIIEDGLPKAGGPLSGPRRRYCCKNYSTCLDLAAALNWDNFTCRGCSGDIDQTLRWRASHALKKDSFVRSICELSSVTSTVNTSTGTEPEPTPQVRIAGKRE